MSIVGVGVCKIWDDAKLQVIDEWCNSFVGLELFLLLRFPDNGANFESSFESQNQSLEADIARDTGDLTGISNAQWAIWGRGTVTRMRSLDMADCDQERLAIILEY
jgi:hypothetical protein